MLGFIVRAVSSFLAVLALVVMATVSGQAQSGDLSALNRQVVQLLRSGKYAEAVVVARRDLALAENKNTIFLCNYPASEDLRRDINSGLNVIERWNGVNSCISFGKGGEMATNRLDDQEISVLALHLLQISLVYVNTLMIQQVLSEPAWRVRMTERDLGALSPLPHGHINPYGIFDLKMKERLALEALPAAA